jgi:ATP-dependent RNA helicase DDX5/DBP2
MDGSKVLIFSNTKRIADTICRSLRQDGWPARVIHGDKSQTERDWVLAEFRSGKSPLMIATDVAARGIDVKDIKVVINFDFPSCVEDYVHRIGRTGRAGEKGTSITFFTPEDGKKAKELIAVLKESQAPIPEELLKYSGMSHGNGRGRWNTGKSFGGGHSSYTHSGSKPISYGGNNDRKDDRYSSSSSSNNSDQYSRYGSSSSSNNGHSSSNGNGHAASYGTGQPASNGSYSAVPGSSYGAYQQYSQPASYTPGSYSAAPIGPSAPLSAVARK